MCFLAESQNSPKACYQDWNNWLSLESEAITNSFFALDIVLLIVAYTALFFVGETFDSKIDEGFLDNGQPRLGDKNDFGNFSWVRTDNRPSHLQILELVYYAIYACFPYFLLIVVIFSSLNMHKLNYSDLILCVYMLYLVFFMVNFRRLYTKNLVVLDNFRIFNMIVVFV